MSNITKTLRKLREAKGLSQEKLARLADVANNTIIKIEAGKNQNPTLDTLKKIASVLEVNIDELTK
ncbi:helix-turn-helix transcriptional regulator [Patescibacteria group bacterium]|nr:helix-turn-helix transcriptional regulator [Patescibacteria group bacterium]